MWYVRTGTKVTGPFVEEQLRALRKRGQFSPIHQISTDRVRWESSASLVKLLDAQIDGTSPQSGPLQIGGPRTFQNDQLPDPDGAWYYLDADQQRIGPMGLSALKQLLQNGTLSPQTLVCARGDSEWISIDQSPAMDDAAPGSWGWFIAGFLVIALASIGIGVTLVVRDLQKNKGLTEEVKDDGDKGSGDKTGGNKDTGEKKSNEKVKKGLTPVEDTKVKEDPDKTESKDPDPKDAESKDPLLITSIKDEERVKQAIGLVVCGVRVKLPDGKIVENPTSTGSCFAISSNGHLLTNRHVVDDYAPPKDSSIKLKSGESVPVVIDQPVIVFFNRIRFEAKVLHIDRTFDLAVLKIERTRPQPYFPISKKNEFPRGGKCFALGFPGVANNARSEEEAALLAAKAKNDRFENILLDQNFEYSYQGGEISRVIRDAKKHWSIEHSATIFPGNSGGPLVDDRSIVIGINTQLALGKTGSLPIAFSTGQFKDLVDEFTGGVANWRN